MFVEMQKCDNKISWILSKLKTEMQSNEQKWVKELLLYENIIA